MEVILSREINSMISGENWSHHTGRQVRLKWEYKRGCAWNVDMGVLSTLLCNESNCQHDCELDSLIALPSLIQAFHSWASHSPTVFSPSLHLFHGLNHRHIWCLHESKIELWSYLWHYTTHKNISWNFNPCEDGPKWSTPDCECTNITQICPNW